MDGWMTCELTSLSTVFHLYPDDGKMISKVFVKWNVYNWKEFHLKRDSNLGPLDQ